MMGGILVATVLTILVLPAGYALFFGREPKKSTAEPEKADEVNADAEVEESIVYPPAVAAE
ncbi:hypothetical protein D9M70_541410 [compost metagenome]